ncbi:hypothetical protein EBT25_12000, partial [bacterium]|nr:hypothetical protein [bacterium]
MTEKEKLDRAACDSAWHIVWLVENGHLNDRTSLKVAFDYLSAYADLSDPREFVAVAVVTGEQPIRVLVGAALRLRVDREFPAELQLRGREIDLVLREVGREGVPLSLIHI